MMKIKNILAIAAMASFALTPARAAIRNFAVDVDVFQSSEGKPDGIAEVVWSINRGALALERIDRSWSDALEFRLSLSKGDEVVDTITLKRIVEIPEGEMVSQDYLLFDKYVANLPFGEYSLHILAIDIADGDSAEREVDFRIDAPSKGMSISDIALLSQVSIDSAGGPFTTGKLKMLPNPAAAFGSAFPVLYLYAEAYPEEGPDSLVVAFSILDSNGTELKRFPPLKKGYSSGTIPILNGFNIMGYPEGKYILRVSITSQKSGESSVAERGFTIHKAGSKPVAARPVVDSLQLEREYRYAVYLMSSNDKNFYKKLTNEGKNEFLKRWWEDRDPNKRTAENEYRAEIIDRWNYANAAFSESGGNEKNGWATDRGRIYIQFGPPDNIERNSIAMGSNSWEQWDYFSAEGGIYFIFADALGIGRYRLVHSTAEGEIFDPQWMRKLNNPHVPIMDIEK